MLYEKKDRVFELLASEPQGITLEHIEADTFVVDTGNADIQQGCYDHHSGSGYGSAAETIYYNEGNVRGRIAGLAGGEAVPSLKIKMHREPDFDCIASAWLIITIDGHRTDKKLPDGTYTVAKYASFIDQGRLSISRVNPHNPAAILYAVYGLYEKSGPEESEADFVIRKGLRLMDALREYAADKNLDELLKGKNGEETVAILNDITLSDEAFSDEYKIIDEDWARYQEDKRKLCKERTDFKVFARRNCSDRCIQKDYCSDCGGDRIEECRALIWYGKPTCLFHKQWARLEGYVLTFIPCDPQKQANKQAVAGPNTGPNDGPDGRLSGGPYCETPSGRVPLSRAIISVNPEQEYCLKNLAVILEIMECEKEERLLGGQAGEKRSRSRKRGGYEDEPWVTNIDPWYDGRNYKNTIVDAPATGSLLTIDEILYAAEHYTEKCIQSVKSRIAYPFLYESIEDYKKLTEAFDNRYRRISAGEGKSGAVPEKMFPKMKEEGYLRDHAKDYFCGRSRSKGGSGGYGSWYEASDFLPSDGKKAENVRIVLFGTGIGFVFREEEDSFFEARNSIDTGRIREKIADCRREGLEYIRSMPSCKPLAPVFQIYCRVNGTYFNYMQGAEKIAGLVLNNQNADGLTASDGQYRISGRGSLIGLSLSANVLVEFEDAAAASSAKRDGLEDRFRNEWYLEYLLAVHQTEAMMNYRLLIGQAPSNKNYRHIAYLREHFVDFMSRGYFANVTSDTLGAGLYAKWQELLSAERIKNEVLEQIGSLDDIANRKFQKNISVITFILLPVTVVLTVIQAGTGLIGLEGRGPGIWITLLACLASSIPGIAYYFLSKDKEV